MFQTSGPLHSAKELPSLKLNSQTRLVLTRLSADDDTDHRALSPPFLSVTTALTIPHLPRGMTRVEQRAHESSSKNRSVIVTASTSPPASHSSSVIESPNEGSPGMLIVNSSPMFSAPLLRRCFKHNRLNGPTVAQGKCSAEAIGELGARVNSQELVHGGG